MRLAMQLGRVNWRAMLREISPEEFVEWLAYERIEPFGRPWNQASMAASVVANEIRMIASGLGGGKIQQDDLYGIDDFVPGVGEEKQKIERDKQIDSLKCLMGF